jgi:hypothetical protein
VRDHLIRHGFMEQFTRWVQHGENIEIVHNIKNIVRDELGGYCADDLNLGNNERMNRRMKM